MSEPRTATGRLNLVATNTRARSADSNDRGWVADAACASVDPEELFVRGAAQHRAAMICRHCPVMRECAADALDNQVEFGVWGGMTERERRALLKRHPEVVSWSSFLNKRGARPTG